ncbi:4-diphosphocytidyl-2C-methyl-D-erythritol kinase [Lysinibacillus sp. 54212]|uniref:4-diphosphocytidyl-2C-methyl-D-erythritol kinase n=1 Tax=Lysinibacillus sp. 54212 TaxID=3119829 RepID=UPI002FC7A758
MEHLPLLYIPSPPPAKQITEEESTSIYVKKEPVQPLILHQLRFFSRPINKERQLFIKLKNGEKLIGVVEKLNGNEVLVNTFQQKIWLDAESIENISTK